MTRLSRAKLIEIIKGSDVAPTREAAEKVVTEITRRRRRFVVPPMFTHTPQKASHIGLIHACYSANPGEALCPNRHRGCKHRPELLLTHHSKPGLELWQCKGCTGFLIRVEKGRREPGVF